MAEDSTEQWSIVAFRRRLEQAGREADAEEANKYAQSITRKLRFASWHAEKVFDLQSDVAPPEARHSELFVALLKSVAPGPDRGPGDAVRAARFEGEAHLHAFIHMLHTTPDTVCQLARVALQMPTLPVQVHTSRFPKELPATSATRKELSALLEHNEWRYLNALANTSKHYLLTDVKDRLHVGAELRYGLYLHGFEHKGDAYRERWANDFVEAAHDALIPQILTILYAMDADLDG